MRWSWSSFAAGLLGGILLTALLWVTLAGEGSGWLPARTATPRGGGAGDAAGRDSDPAGEPVGEETPGEELPAAAADGGRRRVDPAAVRDHGGASPENGGSLPAGVSGGTVISDGDGSASIRISGTTLSFKTVVTDGRLRLVGTFDPYGSDPAPGLLSWALQRSREVVPEGAVTRGDAARLLAADGYMERAAGLGHATRTSPPALDLLLDAARDTSYPDLRGAALLAAVKAAPDDPDVRAAVLELALDPDSRVRLAATGKLADMGAEGAARAAEILASGDYSRGLIDALTGPIAAHGDVGAFLATSPPPHVTAALLRQIAGRVTEPKSDDDRRLAAALPQLVRPLLEGEGAAANAKAALPQLAELGHGAFLSGVATTPVYADDVRLAALDAALGDDATRDAGIAATARLLTDPSASVALAQGVIGRIKEEWLSDATLAGSLAAAARSHPSAWVRDQAAARLAQHDPRSRGTLVIHSARYGHGDDWVDVTDAVRGAVADGGLRVQASNSLGGDPKVGAGKTLHVEYSIGGERRMASAHEGLWLELP